MSNQNLKAKVTKQLERGAKRPDSQRAVPGPGNTPLSEGGPTFRPCAQSKVSVLGWAMAPLSVSQRPMLNRTTR